MTILNPAELQRAGIKALTDVLGEADAQEFLTQWRGIPGRDFAKWLNEHPAQSNEELLADIAKQRVADGKVLRMMGAVACE